MKRIISKINRIVKPIKVPDDFNSNISAWLLEQAKANNLSWLLAHANDGVIWGEVRSDGLHLSSTLFGPDLQDRTLQMARLFSETGELLLWRGDDGWKARLVKDGKGEVKEYYDEGHLLWGTAMDKNEDGSILSKDGFILLRHGAEGLCHAPPLRLQDANKLPLQLNVRHYLNYDGEGQVYVKFSRLISISSFDERKVF